MQDLDVQQTAKNIEEKLIEAVTTDGRDDVLIKEVHQEIEQARAAGKLDDVLNQIRRDQSVTSRVMALFGYPSIEITNEGGATSINAEASHDGKIDGVSVIVTEGSTGTGSRLASKQAAELGAGYKSGLD